MNSTKRMRTEYSHRHCRWSRWKIVDWLKTKRCPQCNKKRLQPGHDNDRFLVRCNNCGLRFAVKPPKEALK